MGKEKTHKVVLSAGAISNGYLRVCRSWFDDRALPSPDTILTLDVEGVGTIKSALDPKRRMFRWRGWRKFYRTHALGAGDSVVLKVRGKSRLHVAPSRRQTDDADPISPFVNRVLCGDAVKMMQRLPSESVHLIVTSPPYWNLVDYGVDGQIGQDSYEKYLHDLLEVWRESFRILVPNGKLCINTPIIPIPKKQMNNSHTRHLKNLNNDIEAAILHDDVARFERFSLYIWQKQTSVKMFGSYPYPPNLYEDNTVEFINVLVKPGKPRKLSKIVKEASCLSQKHWLNLTMQVWPIYPEDVARAGGHPAPFPVVLPQRLILMYTFRAVPKAGFAGDVVLDPFNGTGATCLAAKAAGRRYIGIDISEQYCAVARHRLEPDKIAAPNLTLKRVKMRSVTADEPEDLLFPDDV